MVSNSDDCGLLFSAPALAQNAPGQPASPPAAPAKLSGEDQTFLQKSTEAITSELKLGQLAVDKGSSPAVKQFGQKSISEFQQAQQNLNKLADSLKWIAPDHMSQDAAGQYDNLWTQQGKNFDSNYIGNEISNYQNYISMFEHEADNGQDHQLARYAQSLLPQLRARLDTAKGIGEKVGS